MRPSRAFSRNGNTGMRAWLVSGRTASPRRCAPIPVQVSLCPGVCGQPLERVTCNNGRAVQIVAICGGTLVNQTETQNHSRPAKPLEAGKGQILIKCRDAHPRVSVQEL
jgi:hypothetical protein